MQKRWEPKRIRAVPVALSIEEENKFVEDLGKIFYEYYSQLDLDQDPLKTTDCVSYCHNLNTQRTGTDG